MRGYIVASVLVITTALLATLAEAQSAYNCPYAGGSGGINCTDDETCCGYRSMSPKCLPKDTDLQCCTHFISATTCNASQSCCGAYGVGASSYAFCCDAGTSCCRSMSGHDGATCCADGTTCCQASSVGVCCGPDEECVPSQNACMSKTTTAAPETTTNAPAPATPAPAAYNCIAAGGAGGVNCGDSEDCCGYNTMTPHCLPKATDQKCCVHYKSATTCNASQTCCGEFGVGASSYAFCCNEGTTCCHDMFLDNAATCCPTGTTCCAGTTTGLCCQPDEDCVPNQNSCVKKGTAPSSTNAPDVPPPTTTPAAGPSGPTTPATMPSAPTTGASPSGPSSTTGAPSGPEAQPTDSAQPGPTPSAPAPTATPGAPPVLGGPGDTGAASPRTTLACVAAVALLASALA